jgi:dTDP-glucose pyrophosphorylase
LSDDIRPFLAERGLSLKEAMEQLEKTEERILFIVEDSNRLYGTVTDGDIRRWILAHGTVEGTVDQIYNRRPYSVGPGFNVDVVKRTIVDRKFGCVPVVDDDGRVVELLFWDRLFGDGEGVAAPRPIDVPVVIMAGGKGTRLDPFTRILPKPLIPIGDKTVIETIMDAFARHGVGHFYVSLHTKARIVKSYFEELDPPFRIEYVEEDEPLGTAGALQFLKGRINGTFFVTNCDVIIKADCADLLDQHRRDGNAITIVASLKSYSIPYGICEIEPEGRFTGIREKPEYRFLVNTGMYAIESSVLSTIPPRRMYHITHLIEDVKAKGGRIGVYPISETAWMDTGEWAEYKRTLQQFAL